MTHARDPTWPRCIVAGGGGGIDIATIDKINKLSQNKRNSICNKMFSITLLFFRACLTNNFKREKKNKCYLLFHTGHYYVFGLCFCVNEGSYMFVFVLNFFDEDDMLANPFPVDDRKPWTYMSNVNTPHNIITKRLIVFPLTSTQL